MKKKLLAGVIGLSMLASMGAGAYAASNLQEIQAYLNSGLKFKVDGQPVQLRDGNGNAVLPITYKGTTYLPVRAVSDALGVAVNYDAQAATVHLGERSEGVAILDGFSDMYHTKDTSKTSYNGKDYKEVYFNDASGNRSGSFMLYPKKKYQKLYLQVAAVGKDIEELTIQENGSMKELLQTSVALGEGLKTIEVDIGGVEALYIHADLVDGGAMFVPLIASYYK
ncbi:hypothetical protein B1A99_05320 [Cohnella sp. CIP 111063]|uniref:stalk domain-containing protein n=1 Tax=unclassified Cohnella TaxID=2636738 RepID=UPI000B8C69D2|nr:MULTISPECIES: stalk domain-containing protein [unclassified Cohnella]OXS60953.1 hypothetical protein B1A99_05320 [Cohnella sp. CIP 111063]PRX73487.1 copper amine oxidase-like protein [Cohnella sp. SGD-V74]